MNLDRLLQQPHALPAVPKVVHELLQTFNDEDVAVAEVVRRIASDQVLSARLLRLANSAYYHVPRTVATVDDAVAMLGFVNVRTLVISTGLTGSFRSLPGFDLKQAWRHSLHTACVARHLAKGFETRSDLAFTVGLMHSIGQMVMHAGMPQLMLELGKTVPLLDPGRLDAERQVVGYHHLDVSAELARRWKFPEAFSQAIEAIELPLQHVPFDPVGALVHIAAWRSRAHENQLNAEELEAAWPSAVADSLGLEQATLLRDLPAWEELAAGMEGLLA